MLKLYKVELKLERLTRRLGFRIVPEKIAAGARNFSIHSTGDTIAEHVAEYLFIYLFLCIILNLHVCSSPLNKVERFS